MLHRRAAVPIQWRLMHAAGSKSTATLQAVQMRRMRLGPGARGRSGLPLTPVMAATSPVETEVSRPHTSQVLLTDFQHTFDDALSHVCDLQQQVLAAPPGE